MAILANSFLGYVYYEYGDEILAVATTPTNERIQFFEDGSGRIISEDGSKQISFQHDLVHPRVLYHNGSIMFPNGTVIMD